MPDGKDHITLETKSLQLSPANVEVCEDWCDPQFLARAIFVNCSECIAIYHILCIMNLIQTTAAIHITLNRCISESNSSTTYVAP